MDAYPSLWIITKPAANFVATLNLYNTAAGTLIATSTVLEADSLDTLWSRVKKGRKRYPRFPSQPVTVLENWQ
jgi:hypothetical protein